MAVTVYTTDPPALLQAIRAAINGGKIETWSVDSDGDFTHSPDQWKLQAWFRPVTSSGKIVFRILTAQKRNMTKSTYGVYHGRFIEMLLNHFDTQFDRVVASALPTEGDQVKG